MGKVPIGSLYGRGRVGDGPSLSNLGELSAYAKIRGERQDLDRDDMPSRAHSVRPHSMFRETRISTAGMMID